MPFANKQAKPQQADQEMADEDYISSDEDEAAAEAW